MNGPIWERGRYGYGLLLDGSNDFVDVLPSASVVNAMQTSGTVSMWVKTDFPSGSGAGTGKGFFQIGSSPGNSLEFYKHTNIANGPQFEVFYEGGYHKITPSVPVWDTHTRQLDPFCRHMAVEERHRIQGDENVLERNADYRNTNQLIVDTAVL
jgi:hypothetical protein